MSQFEDERSQPARRRPAAKGRYSPADCIGTKKIRIEGDPDHRHVSTSYVERSNLKLRHYRQLGLSGDDKYLIHVTGKPGSLLPFVTFGAWGDAKVELDYQSQQGRAGFTAKFDGRAFLGFQGVF